MIIDGSAQPDDIIFERFYFFACDESSVNAIFLTKNAQSMHKEKITRSSAFFPLLHRDFYYSEKLILLSFSFLFFYIKGVADSRFHNTTTGAHRCFCTIGHQRAVEVFFFHFNNTFECVQSNGESLKPLTIIYIYFIETQVHDVIYYLGYSEGNEKTIGVSIILY